MMMVMLMLMLMYCSISEFGFVAVFDFARVTRESGLARIPMVYKKRTEQASRVVRNLCTIELELLEV
jgi:hypothetical protein